MIRAGAKNIEVDHSIWDLSFEALGGERVDLKDYRGSPLLLNFWGEWCYPCITEIPDLIENQETQMNAGLQIISFLKPNDLKKAKELIKEKAMNWPKIILNRDFAEKLRIVSWPTNILILPGGNDGIRTGQVTTSFIEQYLE